MLLIKRHLPTPVPDWPVEVCLCAAGTEQADPVMEKRDIQ